MNRILLIAAVVVSIATAGLGFLNKMKLDETKQNLADMTESRDKEQVAHTATKATLATTEESLKTTTAAKEKAEEDLKTAQTSLEETKTKLATAEEKAKDNDEKVAEINKKLEEANTALAAAKEELDKAKTVATNETEKPEVATVAKSEAEEKLEKAEATIANLQGELTIAKAQTQALQEAEAARRALTARNDVQGLVTAVNKPWNFVVLNLGDRQGVAQGSEMLIQRGNDFIGRVRVRSVNPADSVADIDVSSLPRGVEIKPGDSVIFRAAR